MLAIMKLDVNTERLARYRDKMAYIIVHLAEIDRVLPSPTGIVLHGVFYNLQTSIESAMDIAAMLVRDLGLVPKGDRENLKALVKAGVISQSLAEKLARCNGLRNVIVHRYNNMDEDRVISSVPEVSQTLRKFVELVEMILDGH